MSQTNNSCGGGKAGCFLIIMGVIFLLAGTGSASPAASLFGWAAIGLAAILYYNQRSATLRRKNEEVLGKLLAQRKQEAVEEQEREEQEFQAQTRSVDQLVSLLERQQAGKEEREQAREPDAEQTQIVQQISAGWAVEQAAVEPVNIEPLEVVDALVADLEPDYTVTEETQSALIPEDKPEQLPAQAPSPHVSQFSTPSAETKPEHKLKPAPTLSDKDDEETESVSPETKEAPTISGGQGGYSYQPKLVNSRFGAPPDRNKNTTPPAEGSKEQ